MQTINNPLLISKNEPHFKLKINTFQIQENSFQVLARKSRKPRNGNSADIMRKVPFQDKEIWY